MTNSADPDLDLHCLLRQGMLCSAREGLRPIKKHHGIYAHCACPEEAADTYSVVCTFVYILKGIETPREITP